jgi:YbbR domain-containing protein
MDKFMDSRWFLRGIALLVTLLLFMSVNLEPQTSSTNFGEFPVFSRSDVIKDVPVTAIYDQENLIVTGVPKSVSVTLDGPTSLVKAAKLKKDFEVYLDLSDYALGTYEVRLNIRNLSDKIKATLKPRTVTVSIREKMEKAVPVTVEYLNQGKVKNGYRTEPAIVEPAKVNVIGTEQEIALVSYAKAIVDVAKANQTFSQRLRVHLYTKQGKEIFLRTKPRTVEVTVPVVSKSQTFPIKFVPSGTLLDNLKLRSIDSDTNEVTVYAAKDWLDSFTGPIEVPVDLSSILDSGSYELTVPLPDGAFKVSPSTIKVNVVLDKEGVKKYTNIPVQLVGENDNFNYKILSPSNGQLIVTARGFPDELGAIQSKDITVTSKVADFKAGTYDLSLSISGPKNVVYTLNMDTIKVEITEKTPSKTDQTDKSGQTTE